MTRKYSVLLIAVIILLSFGCGRSKTVVFKAKGLDAEGMEAISYGGGDKKYYLMNVWDDLYAWILAEGYGNIDKEKVYDYYITLKKGANVDPKKYLGFLEALNMPSHGPRTDSVFAWHYDEGVLLGFQGMENGKKEERREIEYENYIMTIVVKNYEIEKIDYEDKLTGVKLKLSFFKSIEMEITVKE